MWWLVWIGIGLFIALLFNASGGTTT